MESGTWLGRRIYSLEADVKHLVVAGCGRVFERYYLPALRDMPAWRLVAAVDTRADRRQWIEASLPSVAVHESLDRLPPEMHVDAVLIATPPDTHYRLADEALRRGAHVLLEKPMTPRLPEAEALVARARACGRQIWVGFNRRFRAPYDALRERLRRVPHEHITTIEYHLRTDVQDWQAISSYLGDEHRGGDVLDDIASHQLDLIPWLLARPVREVSASSASRETAATAVDVVIGLRFDDGLVARCHASHQGPPAERLELGLRRGRLLVTRGGITATGPLPFAVARHIAGFKDASASVVRRLRRQPSVAVLSVYRQLTEWCHALQSGHSTSAADGAAGARCVALVEACRESLALGGIWVAPRPPVPIS
jgi:predicted dehydrogenase